jgi:hypothetical protein
MSSAATSTKDCCGAGSKSFRSATSSASRYGYISRAKSVECRFLPTQFSKRFNELPEG